MCRKIYDLKTGVEHWKSLNMLMSFSYLTPACRHVRHIQHYVRSCSVGDWFVLYQMNKNMNKRFFAEFLALLSLKVVKCSICRHGALGEPWPLRRMWSRGGYRQEPGRRRCKLLWWGRSRWVYNIFWYFLFISQKMVNFDTENFHFTENMKHRLERKKAWRRKINFFTGKRYTPVFYCTLFTHLYRQCL